MRTLVISVAVLAGLMLAGCYEDPNDVTLHEPGVYKGQRDELVAKEASAQRQEQLRERFHQVQTDR
ncbi:MAG: hypothetical protein R3310_01005 [Candidatus Competibacteraceae bacterium]|nr:hypothetical protein [Candidatus Competibacteraceae bacterium]